MNTLILEKICRCCLNENDPLTNLLDKFVDGDVNFDPCLTFSDAILLCTNVRCDEDTIDANDQIIELPKTICERCLSELRIAVNFRAKCEASDNLLRQQIIDANHLVFEHFSVEETVDHKQTNGSVLVTVTNSNDVDDDNGGNQNVHLENIENEENSSILLTCEISNIPIITDEDEPQPIDELRLKTVAKPKIKAVSLATPNKIAVIRNTRKNQPTTKLKIVEKHKNWFECEQCKKGFSLQQDLTKHVEFAHNGRTLHLCNVCGQLCSNESTLKTHMLQHQEKRYKCDLCPKTFFTKTGYRMHCNQHQSQAPEKKFLCSVCGQNFTTRQRLKIHTFTHTKEKNHKCDLCIKSFATESRLRSHRRTHTGERPYKCSECGLTFTQGNALKCHKRIHTGERPYECKFCFKRFSQNTILKTHLTLHTGKTVKCPDCDKKFSRASYLILHRREHTGEKPYVCDRCPNRYKQKSHLDRHMDTHLGVKHVCEICKKEYSKQWSLKMHMYTHSDKKPYQCNVCSMEFIRKDKYNNHIKLVHGTNPTTDIIKIDIVSEAAKGINL